MHIGVLILPEFPWSTAQDMWRRAEALGFDHAWTYDHMTWRSFRNQAWFAAIPTLTAAAMVTESIRLGVLVASPNFRHPLPFAKELIALDDISSGRLTVGIGAGSSGWDATMLGQEAWSRRERANRFAEFVKLTDLLLREPETTYQGEFYTAIEARTYPGCVQRPRIPLAIAATGKQGMYLAAVYGQIWVTNGDRTREEIMKAPEGAKVVAQQMSRLDEMCLRVGRDPATLRRLVLSGPRLDSGLASVEAFKDTVGRYAEIGVTDFVVHWPRSDEPYAADLATFERIFADKSLFSKLRSSPEQNSILDKG
jgi:alkanesulfonate monooxygenase SsuD/methylene tetrahydromethanopterin reductase-like flavin-dependent oxidoreductase (luciferase family)